MNEKGCERCCYEGYNINCGVTLTAHAAKSVFPASAGGEAGIDEAMHDAGSGEVISRDKIIGGDRERGSWNRT